jgi:hypothetical protein
MPVDIPRQSISIVGAIRIPTLSLDSRNNW